LPGIELWLKRHQAHILITVPTEQSHMAVEIVIYCHYSDLENFKIQQQFCGIRGLLEKYPTFGREKETGLLGALDT